MSQHEQPGPNGTTDFERDLEAVETAWRRLSAEAPPDLVDQAVRNRARLELERGRPRRLRWIGHFATAGVVVLAVSIWLLQDWDTPPAPAEGELRLERAAEETAPARQAAEPAPMKREMRAKSAPVAAQPPAAAALAEEAADEAPDPEAWIAELLALKAAGRTAELEAGLAAFRAAWPDHPLPPELAGD